MGGMLKHPAKLLFIVQAPYVLNAGHILDCICQALTAEKLEFHLVEYTGTLPLPASVVSMSIKRTVTVFLKKSTTQLMTAMELRTASSRVKSQLDKEFDENVYVKDKLVLHKNDDEDDSIITVTPEPRTRS